jgi:hypothetical protein
MTAFITAFLLLFILSLPAVAGQGQEGHAAEGAGLPALRFESVFDGYKPYVHQAPAPWRQSVDRVGEVGGWRAYAREAAEPEDSGAQHGAPETPHSGHDHGGAP